MGKIALTKDCKGREAYLKEADTLDLVCNVLLDYSLGVDKYESEK